MHRAYVAKLLRLTLLVPAIVAAVLDSRLPKGVRLEDLVRHRCRWSSGVSSANIFAS